jgi:hypothetical protein
MLAGLQHELAGLAAEQASAGRRKEVSARPAAFVDTGERWLEAFDASGAPQLRLLAAPPRLLPGATCRVDADHVELYPSVQRGASRSSRLNAGTAVHVLRIRLVPGDCLLVHASVGANDVRIFLPTPFHSAPVARGR